jgi:[FeFe] hydrogenase H-cluster maturation GTPase HydF
MSLNDTPTSERVHIGFFGTRNAGKSSLVNKVTGQRLAVVSDTKGTTTDPVYKTMEMLPLGPVVIIDTPGVDDEGELGELRVAKTKEVLRKTDIAVLVVDGTRGLSKYDTDMIRMFEQKSIPFVIAVNKLDLCSDCGEQIKNSVDANVDKSDIIFLSAERGEGIEELKQSIIEKYKKELSSFSNTERWIVSDFVEEEDIVILVIPIDSAAPKGRIILPQQQTLRELLDKKAIALVCTEDKLEATIKACSKKPELVITDSQVFEEVADILPEDIMLTSFSILMARYKGFLEVASEGVKAVDSLKDGDCILICEGCTHHRQCDDIGTVKIPKWLKKYTGKDLIIETCSGREFPEDLEKYALVIHCGACMLNEREVISRMNNAVGQNVPFTNYGITIAKMKGILDRATKVIVEKT